MTEEDENDIRSELIRLRQEHRDLDIAIGALVDTGRGDHLTLQRLKKKKLAINARRVEAHMNAVRAVADLLKNAVREADGDGTYSQEQFQYSEV